MELNVKAIIAGIVLFVLGGASVYLIGKASDDSAPIHAATAATTASSIDNTVAPAESPATESFYAAADARREQHLADKAEEDRLAKLTAAKERSVECKFWKQQQKTSSAAAKIDEKIEEHCTIKKAGSSAAAEESSSSYASENASTSTTK